jgi:hypothetical protein
MARPPAILALAMLPLLAVGAACKRSASDGQPFSCDCELLTDTDGVSSVKVTICEADPSVAERAARGCAQSGAPAQIQSCSCQSIPGTASCQPGSCKVEERR